MTILETSIRAVVVFPDRARVMRQGEISLPPGTHTVEINNLPVQLNPDSARVAARGIASARLLGLQIERKYYTETPAEQVREMETQLEALSDEMAQLDQQIELIKQSRAKVDALASHSQVYATALAAGEMKIEAQLALFDGLRKRASELDAESSGLGIQKRALDRRIQQIKKQLEQLRGARARERFAALVEVEVLHAGSLTFELAYLVSQAGWKPLYDLRLLEQQAEPMLDVGYLAQVSQSSSEDWNDIELTLSTARPALAATLPELSPWYIQPRPPVMMQAVAREKRVMTGAPAPAPMALASQEEVADAAPLMAAVEATANVDSSGAAVTYNLPGRVSIPGDGAPHKVTVARYSLPPKLDYVTAPKLVQAAYRRAKSINDSPYTLLPGAANLFADEEFIGAASLKLTAPQAEIELYLGADDRVKIEREIKRQEVEKTLIGGKRRVHYGYEIRLENLLTTSAQVTVHDQMPVPRHEEIKVRLESAEPKPTQQSELNLLDWELILAAKEKRTIRFDFVVEYPQTLEVFGLP